MSKADLSYDDWIGYVFDHAVPFYEQAWYLEPDADWWSPRPEQAIDYLTRLFENPEPLTEQFADSQIGQGLHYLVSESVGSYCRFLNDGTVPIEARVACIEAMRTLFARLFQPRCEPILLHLDEPGGNELNKICYMWWDIAAAAASSKPRRRPDAIHEACLSVMRDTLRLPNPKRMRCTASAIGRAPIRSLPPRRSMLISPPIRTCARSSSATPRWRAPAASNS